MLYDLHDCGHLVATGAQSRHRVGLYLGPARPFLDTNLCFHNAMQDQYKLKDNISTFIECLGSVESNLPLFHMKGSSWFMFIQYLSVGADSTCQILFIQ